MKSNDCCWKTCDAVSRLSTEQQTSEAIKTAYTVLKVAEIAVKTDMIKEHTHPAACCRHLRSLTYSKRRKPLSTPLYPNLGPMSPMVTPGRGLWVAKSLMGVMKACMP